MKILQLVAFIIVIYISSNIALALNNNFTQGYNQTFSTPNSNNFHQSFSNPNSYMNKNQYTGTSQTPQPIQHNIFNYDTTRYNSNCQFGVCMPGGH